MNRIQEENRKLKLARETKSPELQNKAQCRRVNEYYRELREFDFNDQDSFEKMFKELSA